jgi:hypothetical protein
MTLRQDIICEKVRSVQEIRKALAFLIREQRKLWSKKADGYLEMKYQCDTNEKIIRAKEILKWVLQEDLSFRDYYKQQYGREWPS